MTSAGPRALRVRTVLSFVHRFVLACVLLLCASSVAPRPSTVGVACDVVAASSVARAAGRFEKLHRWQGEAPRPPEELDAVEADGDEDGDGDEERRFDVAESAAPSFRHETVPNEARLARRTERARDTSRLASGPGLPRGPPPSRA